MKKFEQNEHWIFLYWLTFASFLGFLITVATLEGFVGQLFYADRSKIVFLIAGLYVFGTLKAGARAKFLSEEIDTLKIFNSDTPKNAKKEQRPLREILQNLRLFIDEKDYGFYEKEKESINLLFFLNERCKGNHEVNWFLSESILKLGLLGTIIGFILMLGPVTEITTFDVSSVQQILSKMSAGMATALYTTLAGIFGSSTLAFQNLILDKGAENLMNELIILKGNGPGKAL